MGYGAGYVHTLSLAYRSCLKVESGKGIPALILTFFLGLKSHSTPGSPYLGPHSPLYKVGLSLYGILQTEDWLSQFHISTETRDHDPSASKEATSEWCALSSQLGTSIEAFEPFLPAVRYPVSIADVGEPYR